MTFGEAYAIVCPEGGEVTPDSRKYKDIMELMTQSGYVPLHDKLAKESEPTKATTIQGTKRFSERVPVTEPSGYISKKQWLSIDVNKQAFLKHLNKNNNSSLI